MAVEPTPFPSPPPPTPAPRRRPGWRARLRRILLAGILILMPVAVTVVVLTWLFRVMDGIFAPAVSRILGAALRTGEPIHIPGLGLLLSLLVVMLLGWLSTHVGGQRLLRGLERVLLRLPIFRSIYGATKGIVEAVAKTKSEAFKRVVLIEYPKKDLFAVAFVTSGARWGHVDERLSDLLLVFVPTTPNPTSGFLLLVPRHEALDLPISVEEGIRMVISGGILLPRPDPESWPARRAAESAPPG